MEFMALTKDQLVQSLLALNNSESPFVVKQEGEEVVASWNLVDAKWIEIFGKAAMKKAYEIRLKIKEEKREVDYQEREGEVSWKAGLPETRYSIQRFKGKTASFKFGSAYGIKEDGSIGQIYDFDFSTKRIKEPIFGVIEQAGWKVKRPFLLKYLGL